LQWGTISVEVPGFIWEQLSWRSILLTFTVNLWSDVQLCTHLGNLSLFSLLFDWQILFRVYRSDQAVSNCYQLSYHRIYFVLFQVSLRLLLSYIVRLFLLNYASLRPLFTFYTFFCIFSQYYSSECVAEATVKPRWFFYFLLPCGKCLLFNKLIHREFFWQDFEIAFVYFHTHRLWHCECWNTMGIKSINNKSWIKMQWTVVVH